MRRPMLVFAAVAVLAGCARGQGTAPGGDGSSGVAADPRRLAIYEAVIRDQVEWTGETVWIFERLCADAEGPDVRGPCPESFTQAERSALSDALADLGRIRFVSQAEPIVDRIFDEGGGFLVRAGPIDGDGDRVEVPASHYCGGLCGGGSLWVVERTGEGWDVTGPVPGHGVWIS